MRTDYEIVGSYNNQRTSEIESERSVNLFEYIDPRGKKPKSLLSTSGIKNTNSTFNSATGGFRGRQFVYKGNIYEVIGNRVYLTNTTLASTFLGQINTTSGYVGIDANDTQVIFVDGEDGWIWNINSTNFTKITDASFPQNPIDVCYLDGFFVVANGGTNQFQLSLFQNGLVWGPAADTFTASSFTSLLTIANTANYATGVPITLSTTGTLPTPLNITDTYYVIRVSNTTIHLATSAANAAAGTFITLSTNGTPTNTITSLGQLQQAQLTSHPGNIVACRTLHRRLFLFAENFIEPWENAGIGTNLPFRPNRSLLIEYGTAAIGSISVAFDRMIFLSKSPDGLGSVMMITGVTAIPVSPPALDFHLAQFAADPLLGVADAAGFLIKEGEIIFYRLNFTKAQHTFVYNVTMSDEQNKRWHEEEMLDGSRHVAQTHAFFNGRNYYGHYSKPILYQVDSTFATNDGEAIYRMRTPRPIVPGDYRRIRCNRLQLDLLQGVTDTPTTNDQPIVWLSVSKDGGQSYGNKIPALMGAPGQSTFRTVWRKLPIAARGQAFVIKIEYFNKTRFDIFGAAWDYEILPE